MVLLIALVVALSSQVWHASAQPLTAADRSAVLAAGEYHSGCPVSWPQLRVLTVAYWGFDGSAHTGQMIVNEAAAPKLTKVFRGLYRMRFPVRHMALRDTYGPPSLKRPRDGDFTASFECRQAASSPCSGNPTGRTGSWSEHAYGEAVDLNPVENPYVGCGQTRDPTAVSYMNRSRHRPGMVTPAVVRLFASVGWGWGGSWFGSTKDYMHFSATGH